MKSFIASLSAALCLLTSATYADKPGTIKSQEATAAVEKHDREVNELVQAYETKVQELDIAFSKKLKLLRETVAHELKGIQQAVATTNLDDAVRIRDHASEILSRSLSPPAKDSSSAVAAGQSRPQNGKAVVDNKQLKAELAEVKGLFSPVADSTTLLKNIAGKTYQITFASNQKKFWQFRDDGRLVVDGKLSGHWSPCGPIDVVCISGTPRHIDIFRFSEDGAKCDVSYVGDAAKAKHHHTGTLINR